VRKSSSEAAFASYETDVYEKLGELKSAQVVNYNLLYLFSGPQVRMDYKCTYAKGSAMESFEINFKGDRPQIDGYRLDSPQLDKKSSDSGGSADIPEQIRTAPTRSAVLG
jgi:hypothetical protein